MTQQFCRMTTTSSKYGNVAHEVQSKELLHSSSHEQDQTHQLRLLHSWSSAGPCNTDYLPKPKHKQSGNHGSTTTHLLNTAKYLHTLLCTSTASFRGTTTLTPSRRKPAALCGSWTEILHIALVTSSNIVIRHTLDRNYRICLYSVEPTYQSQHQQIGDGPTKCS